jgi:methylated-DNA-[protein]-cysteine S-methyltransferase
MEDGLLEQGVDGSPETASRIQWDVMASPLGALYMALSDGGLCRVDFGVGEAAFLRKLDPLARTEQNKEALAPIARQLGEYFAGARSCFDLALDLSRLTPFQRRVLEATQRIPAGAVWTYGRLARAIGRPKASRAVGQALRRNPVPIVIPCHRVVASDGSLGGYSGGGGLASKRWLLRFEGAL